MQPTGRTHASATTVDWLPQRRPALPSIGAALRPLLGVVVAGYLLALTGALGVIVVGSAERGWSALFRELLHLLVIPVAPAFALAALLRARRCALALLPPLLLLLWLFGPQLVPKAPGASGGSSFRTLTLNTGAAHRLDDPVGIVRLVESADADLICLLEARPDTLATIGRAVRDAYPFQTGAGEIFVLSRFPLSEARRLELPRGMKDALEATVEIDRRLLDLTVVHLQQPEALPSLRLGIGALTRTGLHFSTLARDDAVNQIRQRTRQRGGAQLVVGDFNMTPTSVAYRALTAELHDAYRAGGWGLGHTYPTSRRLFGIDVAAPLLRIDYVFHSAELQTIRAWVPEKSPSDHAPIIADLALR